MTDSFGLTEIISSFVIDFDTAFVPIVYVLYDVIRPSLWNRNSTFDKFSEKSIVPYRIKGFLEIDEATKYFPLFFSAERVFV